MGVKKITRYMTWNYRLGKKEDCYYVYEYINDEEGDSWTEDPIVTNCYESKEEAVEDLERMLEDVKHYEPFDYEA